jgi:anaerobic magnesium-protoporphyrin IX monomethyl ester cyclase
MKAGFARQFYDLGKVDYWGPQSKGKLNFNFDRTRTIAPAQMEDWQSTQDIAAQKRAARLSRTGDFKLPNGAEVKACGGGDQQMEDADADTARIPAE